MKILLIVNLVFAGLFITCSCIFRFFAYGAFVNLVGLYIGFLCSIFASIQLFSIPTLFLINIYGVYKYWSKHKLVTLVPFPVIGIAVVGSFAWDVGAMSIRRFEKYLPDYEAFVKMAEKKHKFGDYDSMRLPKEYKHLGYIAHIYEDKPVSDNEPNTLFVSILVGSAGVFGHTCFLYSSNGEIAPGSKAYREWHYPKRINEHWFRVSD